MKEPKASTRLSGTNREQNGVLRLLKKYEIPFTRENYIHLAFLGGPPDPWTAEDEAELPPQLQDPSKITEEE